MRRLRNISSQHMDELNIERNICYLDARIDSVLRSSLSRLRHEAMPSEYYLQTALLRALHRIPELRRRYELDENKSDRKWGYAVYPEIPFLTRRMHYRDRVDIAISEPQHLKYKPGRIWNYKTKRFASYDWGTAATIGIELKVLRTRNGWSDGRKAVCKDLKDTLDLLRHTRTKFLNMILVAYAEPTTSRELNDFEELAAKVSAECKDTLDNHQKMMWAYFVAAESDFQRKPSIWCAPTLEERQAARP